MEKHNLEWHRQDIKDELQEFNDAKGLFALWSELSDVVYTYTRGKYYSRVEVVFPLARWQFLLGIIYMFPKYTGRWLLFRAAGKKFGKDIYCVRNPKKLHKLHKIAVKYNIDPEEFSNIVKQKLRWRILLP